VAHALLPGSPVSRPFCVALAVCALVAGCSTFKEPGPPKEPPAAPASENTIHLGAVSGKLHGDAFTVKTARYYVDARPGFEKIDIQLIAADAPSTCARLFEGKPASLWLRRRGTTKLVAETSTTSVADGGAWDVHYQVSDDGHWFGVGEANALVVLGEPGPDMKVKGVLWACFRDEAGSCVQGEFLASPCTLSIDEPVRGTAAMERPLPYLLAHDAGVVHLDAGGAK
jgi:hypothetical protein